MKSFALPVAVAAVALLLAESAERKTEFAIWRWRAPERDEARDRRQAVGAAHVANRRRQRHRRSLFGGRDNLGRVRRRRR